MSLTTPPPVHFLLVDDLHENLLALEALLRRDGLVLLKARSGPEALELLLVHEVALALIDVQMPEMDGFELAELMRGTERTRRVPIIFLTAGIPDHQRRFRGYEAGAVDFLTKPIEPHVLSSKAGVFFELWRERAELKAATAENARLLEETRRTAEALREADRRKDEFLATLAHELRNPLAPLGNGLQVLRMTSDATTMTRTRDMMARQLSHMVRLVDDLLDISRVTSGKVRLRPELMDVREAVKVAVEATRPTVEAGRHTLAVQLPESAVHINADTTRIAQVVGNLLTNAAKYTPEGGRIVVSVERQRDQVLIRVADNGLGIPPEMLPKVFDLFTQVGKHLDRSQGGLGIGLALVKKLVELHGGSVHAESEGPGKGSVFTIRLPVLTSLERPSPSAEQHGPAASRPSQAYRVLVVDDHTDSAESLAELLALDGHDVQIAHNGADGLAAASRFRPQVVLLDIGLPGMNGYDVAQALRANRFCANAVLVALTGWGAEEDRKRSKEAGFDLHFVKPIERSGLQKVFSLVSPDAIPR